MSGIYKYREMNILVDESHSYVNFTAERTTQYPVLIDRAILSSDNFDKVLIAYPDYFQRCEDHICFNWQWFYDDNDAYGRLLVFNNVMKLVYADEVQYLIMRKNKEGVLVDTFV